MSTFKKRTYQNFREFRKEIGYLFSQRKKIFILMKGEKVSVTFRERLMLAVTAVNGCRYCSYFHAREALKAGLTEEEMTNLLAGVIKNCPPEEAPALLYAQHWAETGANPDLEAIQKLIETYNSEIAEYINLALRLIRVGNLLGNSFDKILYRISLGHWGK